MSALAKIHSAPDSLSICVVGLGYVGLPLAVAFSQHYRVTGFDIASDKICELKNGRDALGLFTKEQLSRIDFSSHFPAADIFIVAVPTDIDEAKQPDLRPLRRAASMISDAVRPGNLIVVESTVYPGATREIFFPALSKYGLTPGVDIHVGYSPERIVPGRPVGDSNGEGHTLANTVKVVSGDNAVTAQAVFALYSSIVDQLHVAPSIEVAEAAKVLENTQRDLNIALMNEFSMICDRLGVDTQAVIDAAATKWNFHAYRPGLVGGHCIGVDPYYMAYQAARHGFHANVILAGRQINDRMGIYVARQTVKLMMSRGTPKRALVLGATFKENCDDLRNSRVPEIIQELLSYRISVDICDPLVRLGEMHYGAKVIDPDMLTYGVYDAVILAVPHKTFLDPYFSTFFADQIAEGGVLVDVKAVYRDRGFPADAYWHL